MWCLAWGASAPEAGAKASAAPVTATGGLHMGGGGELNAATHSLRNAYHNLSSDWQRQRRRRQQFNYSRCRASGQQHASSGRLSSVGRTTAADSSKRAAAGDATAATAAPAGSTINDVSDAALRSTATCHDCHTSSVVALGGTGRPCAGSCGSSGCCGAAADAADSIGAAASDNDCPAAQPAMPPQHKVEAHVAAADQSADSDGDVEIVDVGPDEADA